HLILNNLLELFFDRTLCFPGDDLKALSQWKTYFDAAHNDVDRVGKVSGEALEVTTPFKIDIEIREPETGRNADSDRRQYSEPGKQHQSARNDRKHDAYDVVGAFAPAELRLAKPGGQ